MAQAYSIIQLNTDAHNPRLVGQKRMSKMDFIGNCKRSPDLAVIPDAIMASLYDEIVGQEIKLLDEDHPAAAKPAEPAAPSLARRMSVAIGITDDLLSPMAGAAGTPPVVKPRNFSFSDVGQRTYDVQQTGLRVRDGPNRLKNAPRKVKIALTGMGKALSCTVLALSFTALPLPRAFNCPLTTLSLAG